MSSNRYVWVLKEGDLQKGLYKEKGEDLCGKWDWIDSKIDKKVFRNKNRWKSKKNYVKEVNIIFVYVGTLLRGMLWLINFR